ncbi:DUF1223 domain-containing protein [Robiginitomaculum antarcticum]|uniref:DUF1223 domain-containing protein n=1 Tax=Robiginitomaculum antarcticum TaxID=437507 RepID=UPI00036DB602|nr:DUF1223 domain-containing protein [Robiginitomaculum antarcticum]
MKKYLSVLTVLSFFAAPAFAGQNAASTVVELFTSQGCSSSPPSNALLKRFAEDDTILALSYGVEYWDYLGWKDTFADPSFTIRQRSYSTSIGHGRVYTPQMVVNGSWDKPRLTKHAVNVDVLSNEAPKLTLHDDGSVEIGESSPERAELVFVTYVPGDQSVAVTRGENSGRTLILTNVVTSVAVLGEYDGRAADFSRNIRTGEAYAVLLQKPDNGAIITAASYTP